MRYITASVFALLFVPAALACSFRYDPAAAVQYYRAEGWQLPGTKAEKGPMREHVSELPELPQVPGAVAQLIQHEYPYVVTLPAQEFVLSGKRKRMRPMQVKATVVRWKMNGHIIAYSYGLIPVTAHRKKGKWVIDLEAGCIFDATFIDDKGDGVFRILTPQPLTPELVPAWARKNES